MLHTSHYQPNSEDQKWLRNCAFTILQTVDVTGDR